MSRSAAPRASTPAEQAVLPLFPLNAVLFPGGPLPLRIFETRYVDMVRHCMRERCPFGVVLIRAGAEVGAVADTAEVGTTARIIDFDAMPDGLLGITCVGEQKFRLKRRWQQSDGLNVADIALLPQEERVALPGEFLHLGALLRKVLPELGDLYAGTPMRPDDAAWVGYRLAEILPVALSEKQQCLEIDDPLVRLGRLNPLIRRTEET
jgi:Lon protease-like protein